MIFNVGDYVRTPENVTTFTGADASMALPWPEGTIWRIIHTSEQAQLPPDSNFLYGEFDYLIQSCNLSNTQITGAQHSDIEPIPELEVLALAANGDLNL